MGKRGRKPSYRIPPPEKIDLSRLGISADNRGMYTVNSDAKGIMYCYNDGEYMIATRSKGYVRIPAKYLGTVIEELQGIMEDIKDLEEMGVKR